MWKPTLFPAAAAALVFLFGACGGARKPSAALSLPAATSAAGAFSVPAGAHADSGGRAELSAVLKIELERLLRLLGAARQASAPPAGPRNAVPDLTAAANPSGTFTLRWSYYNLGDYNQDGAVSIADVTPLAQHFGESAPLNDPLVLTAVIDGSRNGKVDIADVTPIAQNFHASCAGYRVEGAPASGGFTQIATVPFAEAVGAVAGRAQFQHTLSIGPHRRFRVLPVDGEGVCGEPSNVVTVSPVPPAISAVSPLTGTEGAAVQFSAAVTGSPPLSYFWDFGTAATPSASAEPSPTVTLSVPGEYACALAVTNPYGEADFPFTLTVTESGQQPLELWYYQMVNLLVDANVEAALELMERAKDAGYTTAVIADFKFSTIDIQSDHYRENVAAFAQGAAALGMQIVPSLVPIGYSDAFLCHDPNLIEPQPVVDCRFEVVGNEADVVQDCFVTNGGFESYSGNDFAGWNEMDPCSVDTAVCHSGLASVRFDPTGGTNFRITQELAVEPWNCYVITLWLKTSSVSPAGNLWFRVFSKPPEFKSLTFLTYDIQSTQDWTQYRLVFNSQASDAVLLYLGLWGGTGGQFWFDDVSMENAGLINLIRRDGAPLRVTSEDGSVEYLEGPDYDYVEDPLMGHAGSYPGTFDLYHERPVITIPPGSRIHDGDRLRVSYYHCAFVYDLQPAVCLTEEDTYTIIHDALSLVNDIIHPSQVFIAIDEMRVANWCEACQSTGKTPGQLLADCVQRIDEIAHGVNPAWTLLTWSDMFDPYHNAHDDYYLVNGTLEGSWEGLPPAWDIGNWRHFGDRKETLAFFAGRGHRQVLAGYYDESGPDFTIDDWLSEAQSYPGVYAVLYTTWQNDYSDLEAWAQCVHAWEAAQQ